MQKTEKLKTNIFRTIFYAVVLIIAFAQNFFSSHYYSHNLNKPVYNIEEVSLQVSNTDNHQHNSDCLLCFLFSLHNNIILNISSCCLLGVFLFLLTRICSEYKKYLRSNSQSFPRAPPLNI